MTTNTNPIQHIVVLMLENRSYDNMLGGLYLASNASPYNQAPAGQADLDGLGPTPSAYTNPDPNASNQTFPAANQTANTVAPDGTPYPSTSIPLFDPGEQFGAMAYQFTGSPHLTNPYGDGSPTGSGAMQGFTPDYGLQLYPPLTGSSLPTANIPDVMNYFTPAQAWATAWLANNFAVCDSWYASVPTQTFANRAFAHCAAPSVHDGITKLTTYSLIDDYQYVEDSIVDLPSIFSQMDAVGVAKVGSPNWKVYYHDYSISMLVVPYVMKQGTSKTNINVATFDTNDWGDTPRTISALTTKSPNYSLTKLQKVPTTFLDDIALETLPPYSFIEPRYANNVSPGAINNPSGGLIVPNSNHPGGSNFGLPYPPSSANPPIDIGAGEALLAQVYNLIYNSSAYWDNTLLIVTYDEPGGLFDHLPPLAAKTPGQTTKSPSISIPTASAAADPASIGFGFNVLGGRVPTLVIGQCISPGTRINAGQVFDHTSIIATVWECFNLSSGTNGLPSLTKRDGAAPNLMGFIDSGANNNLGACPTS